MRNLNLRGIAVAAIAAGAILAGCSGGGVKSLPPASSPLSSAASVGSTVTVVIGNPGLAQSKARNPQYIPATTQSVIIKYTGDNPSATPQPGGANPPSTALTAGAINNVQGPPPPSSNPNPPAPGTCTQVGSALICVISVTWQVGVLDVYVLAYSGTSGTGTLLASSVTTIQVNSNGSMTTPGTSTPATLTPAGGNIAAAGSGVTMPGSLTLIPANALPVPAPSATAYPAPQVAPVSVSALQSVSFTGADGTAIPPTTAISPVTLTDNDATGNTCLMLLASGGNGKATPCPFAAGSTITLTNSSDQYMVLYNNKFVPGAGFTISASIPGSSATATPAPQKVTVTPKTVDGGFDLTMSATTFGSSGAIVYDSVGKKVYTGLRGGSTSGSAATNPLTITGYSATSGYGTSTNPTIAANKVSNVTTTTNTLSGLGVAALTMGPDNNVWIAEQAAASATQYVAVDAVNSAVVEPKAGLLVGPAANTYVEYKLTASAGTAVLTGIASFGGYIWVTDSLNDIWRINPATGVVIPNNCSASCTATGTGASIPATATNSGTASPMTSAAGAGVTLTPSTNIVVANSALWEGGTSPNKVEKISPDTSTSPSNNCTSSATVPPPVCIATASLTPNTTANAPQTLSTDGTNIYVQNGAALTAYNATNLTQTPAFANFAAAPTGGLTQGVDLWFWTETGNGAEFLKSLTSTSSATTPPNATCNTDATGVLAGLNGLLVGPDQTLLYSPINGGAVTTGAVLCGVIY